MTEHLDLDVLADILADGAAGEATPEHLTRCPGCAATLAELTIASQQTTGQLAALAAPSLPHDIAERLHAALSHEASTSASASVTTLPTASAHPRRRWLPAVAAGLVLLAGVGYGLSRAGGGSGSSTAAGGKAAPAAGPPEVNVVRNSSGTDYTSRATIAAALPGLLVGAAAQRPAVAAAPAPGAAMRPSGAADSQMAATAPDPLARLRDNAGLAECLLALLPPDEPSVRPLALDYASYRGQPAMVVVLPGTVPNKLDVFVVGPGCSRANDSTLFYTSVDKP